ncbi:pilus assembly protein PilM [candidate division KSB1 bacterium]|nr:pilus assembly protein PilM [candidate division KSB1 bacterium]
MLGVVFKNNKLKIVEVESSTGNQYRINRIIEGTLDFPFTLESILENKHAVDYANNLRAYIDQHGFDSEGAAFSLSNDLVIIKKYPYDNNFSDREIVDQVDWEVKQFSFSDGDAYIIDFQKLNSMQNKSHKEMIIVAVRDAVVDFIKTIFKHARLKLQVLDADVFAAIRAINTNYDIRDCAKCALVEIDAHKIQITIVESGEFNFTQPIFLNQNNEESRVIMNDDVVRILSKELKRIILEKKIGEKIEDLSRIFIYGDAVPEDVLKFLQNTYNVRIDRANPFRQLRFAQNVVVDKNIWSKPETFTVCVGSALR